IPIGSATGVGVNPAELNFEPGKDTCALYVINSGETLSEYRLFVDEEYAELVETDTDRFSLEPNSHMKVNVSISSQRVGRAEDLYLYIVSSSPADDLGVSSGIKVPVHIKSTLSIPLVIISVGVLVALAVTFITYRRTSRR
ncbi:MAG: hypothetical protein SVK08_08350, partial [Halobacteriota archaeon]|nr:hypothetical protein [Halobacteriota archaeon]